MDVTAGFTVVAMVQQAAGIVTQLLGLAAMAAVLAAVLALSYRWYTGTAVPQWLAAAVGVAGVALYLGTTAALEAVIREGIEPTEVEIALFNLGGLLAGVGGAILGRSVGDRFGTDVLLWSPTQDAGDVSQFAQTVGRVTTVELPARIEDAAGYDPMPARAKETLAGKRLVFPRGLTDAELERRLSRRLKSDYGVGTVDIEFDDDGTIGYLAVGTRAVGIGATLPPATNAIAVRADPGFSASTGDIVQLWEPEQMRRVLTGELRGVADDVVTIAVDAGDTPKVDPSKRYRLVTLPVNDRPDREFASLLRAAEETFSTVTVEAGSPLHGLVVGALDLTITAIRPEDGEPVPFPDPTYRLAPGDMVFVIARPGAIRRLDAASRPLDPSVADPSLPADDTEPTEGIATAAQADTESADADGFQTAEETESQGDTAGADERSQPTDDPATADSATVADSDGSEPAVRGKADTETFNEIKNELESAQSDSTESDESATTTAPSFDQLKSEFDAGEAEWEEETVSPTTADDETTAGDEATPSAGESGGAPDSDSDQPDDLETQNSDNADAELDVEVAFAEESNDSADDELVSLEEANITFEDEIAADDSDTDEESGDGIDDLTIDEELQGEQPETRSDDLGELAFEDDPAEDLDELRFEDDSSDEFTFDGENTTDSDDTAEDGEEEDGEDEDDTSSGGTSFADLKEEFESGDADWEDDISDSPGGDMRLDE